MKHGDHVRARHDIPPGDGPINRNDEGTIEAVDRDRWTGRKTYMVRFRDSTLAHLTEKDIEPARTTPEATH